MHGHDLADRVWCCPDCGATYSSAAAARECAVRDARDA
jgi:ribosomal protein L37AE/L43A